MPEGLQEITQLIQAAPFEALFLGSKPLNFGPKPPAPAQSPAAPRWRKAQLRRMEKGVIGGLVALSGTYLIWLAIALARGMSHSAMALLAASILGVLWLPVSAWLLVRAASEARARAAEETSAAAERGLEQFRSTRRDKLTGLPSRQAFIDTLSTQLAKAPACAVLLVDLDRFEEFNGLHGEGAGDELLQAFADRLRILSGNRENLARVGNDEFALLIANPDQIANTEALARRIMHSLREPYPAGGTLVEVSVSVGLAMAPTHGTTAEMLMRSARSALQAAKSAGGCTWKLCAHEDAEALQENTRFREELYGAIETGQIVPYYQPIVRLESGEIAKFEVLARWDHPTLGILEPERFIPLAEELGLAGHISNALLRQVALDSAAWPEWCRFSINATAGQLRELIGFLNSQPGAWQRGMDLSRLDVEITENALLSDRELARELIYALHDQGAHAVLDNFGSGTSNFFHLRDMPFDSIKIGKAFIHGLLEDPRTEACVMAMIWLGHGLGIDMVADGIEHQACADRLGKMGCQFAQGFLYAHPMPATKVPALLGMTAAAVS